MPSGIQAEVQSRNTDKGDYFADILIDICFATSYKVEDLLKMPPSRRDRIIARYKERFCKDNK